MIREIQTEDIEKVASLSQKFFSYTIFSKPEKIEERILSKEAKFFVFLENGQIIGFIDIDFTNKIPRLLGIGVDEKHRKQGVATKLINYATGFLTKEGFNTIDLLVKVSNKPAISLYEKLGFQLEGMYPQRIENEDVLIMVKSL